MSTDEIRRMLEGIDESSLKGLRDRAPLLVGYGAALRRSEIAALAVGDLTRRAKGLVITVRRSKGDQDGRGQTVAIARGRHALTDPVAAVIQWQEAAEIHHPQAPLFQRIAWSDRRALGVGLSGQSVSDIVKARAAAAGLGDLGVTGHSLRAGHATTAAEAGVSAEQLARTTRHRDLATLAIYIRPAQVLDDTSSRYLGL